MDTPLPYDPATVEERAIAHGFLICVRDSVVRFVASTERRDRASCGFIFLRKESTEGWTMSDPKRWENLRRARPAVESAAIPRRFLVRRRSDVCHASQGDTQFHYVIMSTWRYAFSRRSVCRGGWRCRAPLRHPAWPGLFPRTRQIGIYQFSGTLIRSWLCMSQTWQKGRRRSPTLRSCRSQLARLCERENHERMYANVLAPILHSRHMPKIEKYVNFSYYLLCDVIFEIMLKGYEDRKYQINKIHCAKKIYMFHNITSEMNSGQKINANSSYTL